MELGAQQGLIDGAGIQFAAGCPFGQGPGRPHQFSPAAVIGADVEVNAGVRRCPGRGVGNQLLQAGGQRRKVAQKANPNLLPFQGFQLPGQDPFKQGHQKTHLLAGPVPVFGGEGIGRQGFNPPITAKPQHPFEGFDPFPVAQHPRQVAALGPTAIAIHDHGNVPRQARRIEPLRKGLGAHNRSGRQHATHPRRSGGSLATLRPAGRARAWLSKSCRRLLVIGRSSFPWQANDRVPVSSDTTIAKH